MSKISSSGSDIFEFFILLIIVVPIALLYFLVYSVDEVKEDARRHIVKSSDYDMPVLLDENFIKNIKDECIINDLKKQVDNMIKTGNTDAKLDFNNYKTAKKICAQEDNKEQYKNSNNLEKIKEALDNSKVSN